MGVDSNNANNNLCTECGLCCSGAMFDYGTLCEGEFDAAQEAGLDCLEVEGVAIFKQSCSQLEGTRCAAYDHRPRTCRAFRCETLKAWENGDIDHEEAFDRVSRARSAVEGVLSALPEGSTVVDARRMRREAGKAEASAQLVAPPTAMIALGLLDLVLDDCFRVPGQRLIMPRP